MSAKVASQQIPSSAQSRTTDSRTSNLSRNDDSGSGGMQTVMSSQAPTASEKTTDSTAEGPGRRRLQRPLSKGSDLNATSFPSNAAGGRRGSVVRRQPSTREQKAPLGPRPQGSPVKRHISTSFLHSVNSSLDSTNDSSESHSISSNPRLSLGTWQRVENQQTPPDSSEFLAPINFDDFHNSIMGEPTLNHFPMPGHAGGGGGYDNKTTTFKSNNPWAKVGPGPGAQSAGSGSRNRPADAGGQAGQMPPPPAPATFRRRRQSLAPAPSSNPIPTKAPRKSVGPGTIPLDNTPGGVARRRPSLVSRKSSNDTNNPEQGNPTFRSRPSNIDGNGDDSKLPAPRNLKAKSLLPPSREPRDNLLTPSGSEHSRSSWTTPSKTGASQPTTPSSAKRVSVMPPHATGLGARTISPTDARRMQRMSMMPQAPPVPHTPPTQPERVPSRPRSSAQSPSMLPRKSVTPSSTRTTPDPNRKSYSSGMSLSSATSYNSIRNSNGSLQPRLSQNLSTSRLPTPKPRVESMAAPEAEEVPPVPAIPKAFESPKGENDPVFPNFHNSTTIPSELAVQNVGSKRNSDSSGNTAGPGQDNPAVPSSRRAPKTPEAKVRSAAPMGKKNLQPLKLPPLNLLPLSTPVAAKIEALKDRDASSQADLGTYTTPPNLNTSKTPSTPLTASKAGFFDIYGEPDPMPKTLVRSSTSHFVLSSTTSGFRPASSSSALGQRELSNEDRTSSPYITSLPKTNGDIVHKSTADTAQSLLPAKPIGPRPQTQSSAFSSNTETLSQLSSPTDPETSSVSGSSLRTRLNLTRKSSTSKAQATAGTEGDPVKYDNMPPPRLPASATWNNLSTASNTSPTLKSAAKARRKSSMSGISNTVTAKSHNVGSDKCRGLDPSPSTTDSGGTEVSHNRSASSILSPVHKILSSAKSSSALRQRPLDPNVDPDDLAAEEEMRRLGSKRKDFETAAKQLDELHRRASPKERVSPGQALKMASLNIFERGEIIDFKDIYFCGTQKAKKHVGDLKSQSANFGYDDDRGDYNIVIGDHLAYRYEVVDVLGKGSFGQVVRCVDHKTGGLVAVKIIRNKKRFHQQALVEVNILQKLKEWDPHRRHSVVNFTQSFYFRGHLCISTELLGMNLYEFIKAHDFRGFSLKLIRTFTKQLLSTLILLQSKKVIHCDLKPENILLVHPMRPEIRVIDFGSSCFEHEKVYTYIQSRFYRSPEVILGMSYGLPIDMWSLGCILAELYTGYPIFPGENEQEQLACIMEVFGPPEKHLIEKSTRKKLFFDSLGKPRLTVSSKGRRRRPSSKDLKQALKCDNEPFLDFVAGCLRWDPSRRLSPTDALNHEFITGIKAPSRSRLYLSSNTSSPVKRVHTMSTPSSRPLPEPPGTSLRNGTAVKNDLSNNSPMKQTPVKRAPNGAQAPSSVRKASNGGSLSGSALPRVAARNVSSKSDLAAAAAATSLRSR
ncbi:hypothetical protein DTO027B9_5051 [Paecilomyces variotii]|nr:hypothetical protein DTO027B9_5051 [Paecilomyces variotii]